MIGQVEPWIPVWTNRRAGHSGGRLRERGLLHCHILSSHFETRTQSAIVSTTTCFAKIEDKISSHVPAFSVKLYRTIVET